MRRFPAGKALRAALSFVLVALILSFTFRDIDVAAVGDQIRDMTLIELVTLAAISVWNLLTYPLVWMAVVPGLSFRRGVALTESPTAVANTVPGGAALGVGMTYAMLSSWGFSRSRSTVGVLVSAAWNSFTKLGMPVVALALVALGGAASAGLVTAALVGIAGLVAAVIVFTLMLRSEEWARRTGQVAGAGVSRFLCVVGRPAVEGWELATTKFRARTIGLLERRWPQITAATLVSHLSLYLVLLVALRHLGVADDEVRWAEVLAVFAFARLATAVPLTPGGLGVVEAVLIAGLAAAGGDKEQVAAAVLVYRAFTWLLPIPVGIVTYLLWRRSTTAGHLRPMEPPVVVGQP